MRLAQLQFPFILRGNKPRVAESPAQGHRARNGRTGTHTQTRLALQVAWLNSQTTLAGLRRTKGPGRGRLWGPTDSGVHGSWWPGPRTKISFCCPSNWDRFPRKSLPPTTPALVLTKGQRETQCQASGGRQREVWPLLCTQVQRHPRDARTGWTAGGGDDSGCPCQPGAGGDRHRHPSTWESKPRK